MNPNVLSSSQSTLVAAINPGSQAAGTITTGWLSFADFEVAQAVILAGTLGTNATIDAKLEQAKDASGTGAKDITGKAITQLTQAGTNKSNKQAVINATAADMDASNDYTHFRLSITVGTASSGLSAVIMAGNFRYNPTPANSVDEIV